MFSVGLDGRDVSGSDDKRLLPTDCWNPFGRETLDDERQVPGFRLEGSADCRHQRRILPQGEFEPKNPIFQNEPDPKISKSSNFPTRKGFHLTAKWGKVNYYTII